ncbi:MAG: hypothetical protein ACE5GK_12745 [Nitrospiria bacterium]
MKGINKKQRSKRFAVPASVILLFVVVICNSSVFSQETDKVKSELFRVMNAEMLSARQDETPVLSPRLFSKAMEFYQRAEVEYKKGERLI